MINKYKNAKAEKASSYAPLPAGGYVAKIAGARIEDYTWGSVLVIAFDIYEGEYTAETLPEYQPKGHGAELVECQRYLQRFRTETERKTYSEDFRPTMRMTDNGVVSTFEKEIDGVTYYFASAEL